MKKKCAVLFSGGKDSTYAAYLVNKEGYETTCLITIESENPDSFMFHTPSIEQTKKQAEAMGIKLVSVKSKGEKEKELLDLENAIKKAKEKYNIEGVVTGAVESVYQASRVQKICNKLDLECFNPLWQKDQAELLNDLIKNKFEVIIVGVAAYPLDEKWLGRRVDNNFIKDISELNRKYKINVVGEGGEFESLVVNCPLFKKKIIIKEKRILGHGNNWKMEILSKKFVGK